MEEGVGDGEDMEALAAGDPLSGSATCNDLGCGVGMIFNERTFFG